MIEYKKNVKNIIVDMEALASSLCMLGVMKKKSILMKIFGNFGLYCGVPEGRNMSIIKDEEALYQNLRNLS